MKCIDAFHLVIPSIPGYGYSGRPTTTGWTPPHHEAWTVLMKRLGYTNSWRRVAPGVPVTEVMGARTAGVAGHSHQHASIDSGRHRPGSVCR